VDNPGNIHPCGLLSAGCRAAEAINNYFAPDMMEFRETKPKDDGDDDEMLSPAHIALLSRVREQVNSFAGNFFRSPCRTLRRYTKLFVTRFAC
jgi:hypothetical protein